MEGGVDPLLEVYYHSSRHVHATSILPLSSHTYEGNTQAHFPGEKRLRGETRALLANFTDVSHMLRGTRTLN